jgi:hypothetical protein
MPQPVNRSPDQSAATRKKLLLADGALYRASIIVARADIAAGLQPGVLAKNAIGRLSETAKVALLDSLRSSAFSPRTLSPLLITGFSLLSKTYIRKPLMYAGIAGGAIAGAIYLIDKFSGKEAVGIDVDSQ